MFRRKFIQGMALASSGLGASAADAAQLRTVVYHVKGFSCITCAVGLETMLKREKGVSRVEASYPDAIARIEYDPHTINETTIRSLISEMGFSVADAHGK